MKGFLFIVLLALSAVHASTPSWAHPFGFSSNGAEVEAEIKIATSLTSRKRHLGPCTPEQSMQCQNGATCISNNDLVQCLCPKTFFGDSCEFQAYVANPLSGLNEVPPNSLPSAEAPFTGFARIIYSPAERSVTLRGSTNVVNVTAAHIHRGAAGTNGGVIVPITFNGDTMVGILNPYSFSEADNSLFLSGMTYVNVHNVQRPAGVIRNQILPFDACENVTCGPNSFCTVVDGFIPSCSIPVDPCEPNPCQNQGDCSPTSDGGATCWCPLGFNGSYCEIAPPSCEVNVCLNGGTCYQTELGSSCVCPDKSHFGVLCEMVNGPELCALNPCKNGGTCLGDLINLEVCQCADGFFGLFCDATPCTGPVCSSTPTAQAIGQNPIPASASIYYDGPIFPTTRARIWLDISHPNNGDLSVVINSPGGFIPLLQMNAQGFSDVFAGTYFTADAEFNADNYPYVNGVAVPEVRPSSFFPLEYYLANATGEWDLLVVDIAAGNDGVFRGWRLELDHENDCEGAVCPEGYTCADRFSSYVCFPPNPNGPCIPEKTCLGGVCQDDGSCHCFPGAVGEFCASAVCTTPVCGVMGLEAPISDLLPPRRSTLEFATLPSVLPPNAALIVTVMIDHTYNDDLKLTLTSPQGTTVVLAAQNGGSFQGLYYQLNFVDSAPQTLTEIPIFQDGIPPYPNVKPLESFQAFIGEDPNGGWVLEITDSQPGDSGALLGWYLIFDFEDQCAMSMCPPERVCVDGANTIDCVCPPGTAGPNCQPISPCNPDPCVYGFCSENGSNSTCNCFGPTTGKFCETMVCSQQVCAAVLQAPVSKELPPTRSSIALSSRPPITATTQIKIQTNLIHAFSNELLITLTSPKGTKIVLSDSIGAGNTFMGATFDSMASVSIVDFTSGPFPSTFRPQGSFAPLVGENPSGIWTLEISDRTYGEDGALLGWSIELIETAPTQCQATVIDNAFFRAAPLNTVAYGSCQPSFYGNPSRRCEANGQFGPAITGCYPWYLTCPASSYANAQWPETYITMSSTGTCNLGWTGAPTRRCTVNGNWETNVVNHCQRVSCQSTILANAQFPKVNAFERAVGTCVSGFTGQVTRECLPSGEFGAPIGECFGPCAAEEYGRASWPSTTAGQTATGVCHPGWTGSTSRKCNPDGTWQTNLLSFCQKVNCPSLDQDGISYPSVPFNQTTFGTCPPGTVGRPTRVCQADGTFGPTTGACLPLTTQCPVNTFGNADWPATNVGVVATGTCVSGWTGTPSRRCATNGAWETNIQNLCKRITCPATNDGLYAFNQMDSNTQAYGRCVVGTGRPWRRCNADGTPGPINGSCA